MSLRQNGCGVWVRTHPVSESLLGAGEERAGEGLLDVLVAVDRRRDRLALRTAQPPSSGWGVFR